MGPKQSNAQSGDYATLLKDYEIVRSVDSEGLFFLKGKTSGGDYLLRQFTFNDKKEFERNVQVLQKRKIQLEGCKYVIPLEKIITKSQDQYCSTFYKIYALFQFTERTLDDEISQRNLQKRRFQEKQLWSILASCIVGLSHLQKQSIKHQALKSSSILISQEGVIKVFDPIVTGCQSNYDSLISKRTSPHIYLSPELSQSLQLEAGQPHSHAYKGDIWTMGMIILEAGLTQYQDECYRDQCSRVHWQTIQYNIHRFRQNYSEQLAALVEFMLSREERNRPDWLQLEERVIKEEELRMSQPNLSRDSHNISRQSNTYRQTEKIHSHVNFNQTIENRFSARQAHPPPPNLLTSNAVPIYQDPNYRKSQNAILSSAGGPRMPFSESNAKSGASISAPQFKPSYIETTRPLRNLFPPSVYTTMTKVDENLIVVAQEDRMSELDTPSNKNISYFQSNTRPKQMAQNQSYHQQQPYFNNFTPTQPAINQEQARMLPQQVSNYRVSHFQSQPQPPAQQIYQSPPRMVQPAVPAPVPVSQNSQLSKSAPEGGEYVVQRYKQGSEYKGFKWQDMRHGFGVFYYQDGGMYEGQWRFNRMQGKGKLYYQSGKLAYEGDWVNDQFQGYGILQNEYPEVINQPLNFKNLDDIEQMWTKYEGEFNGDLKSGRGVLFLTNGQYYDGEFSDDYADGEGVYYRINGQKVRGRWNKNILVE